MLMAYHRSGKWTNVFLFLCRQPFFDDWGEHDTQAH